MIRSALIDACALTVSRATTCPSLMVIDCLFSPNSTEARGQPSKHMVPALAPHTGCVDSQEATACDVTSCPPTLTKAPVMQVTAINLGGYLIAFGGVCWFNYTKLQNMKAKQAAAAANAPSTKAVESGESKPLLNRTPAKTTE